MYSLSAYGEMIADRVRADAYAEALRKTIRKGSIVVEIGTGPGVFAVLACQLGAARVFAIEPAEISRWRRQPRVLRGSFQPRDAPCPRRRYRLRSSRRAALVSAAYSRDRGCPEAVSCARRNLDSAKGYRVGCGRGSSKTVWPSSGPLGPKSLRPKPWPSAASRRERRSESTCESQPAVDRASTLDHLGRSEE